MDALDLGEAQAPQREVDEVDAEVDRAAAAGERRIARVFRSWTDEISGLLGQVKDRLGWTQEKSLQQQEQQEPADRHDCDVGKSV